MTRKTSQHRERLQEEEPISQDSPRDGRLPRRGDERAMLILDGLLVMVALSSAVWACWWEPLESPAGSPRHVTLLDEEVAGLQGTDPRQILYVHCDNTIHYREGAPLRVREWDGQGRLAAALRPAPERMLLLVHPDGLFETSKRTVSVLHNAGVTWVEIAMSETAPFPLAAAAAEGAESSHDVLHVRAADD